MAKREDPCGLRTRADAGDQTPLYVWPPLAERGGSDKAGPDP